MSKPFNEEEYKAVQAQIKQLLDDAATERNDDGMAGLGCVWLAAEMVVRNERAHERAKQEQERNG